MRCFHTVPGQPGRKASAGFNLIQFLGAMMLTLMMSALIIDFSYYFAAQNHLQTTADSAALAAAQELYRDISVDPTEKLSDARTDASNLVADNMKNTVVDNSDVVFGYVDPITKQYNPNTFKTPTTNPDYKLTGGYNAAWVRVRKTSGGPNAPLNTVMANMLGVHSMDTEAQSIAFMDQSALSITNGGVRPIYVCEEQFNKAMQDGVPENNLVRIYGDHLEVDGQGSFSGCPALSSGNWGFADLRDCSSGTVGSSTIGTWFSGGYPGSVQSGQCYSTKPGNFIASIRTELDNLISSGTIFPVPLYDSWSTGGGSTASVNVTGFVGFKITDYKATGSDRYIEGRFYRFVCKQGCGQGTGSNTSPGGAIVRLRLADRS